MPDQFQPCPQCGTRLKPGTTGGLCLRCLLSFGLKDAAVPDEADESTGEFPDTFDRFRIIEKIGEGGCGVVYRAEQLQAVRREVALKVIKLGMDTATVIARFEAERQALAMMDHPGIAKVFDAGSSRSGRPFFAMELVRGERITDFCDRRQLSIPQRLELFARVCEAVQHAHQKGVIHRDLKPSNILVAEDSGAPSIARQESPAESKPSDARRSAALPHAQPKVIDFGIAKATSRQRLADHTIYTAFDQFIGTPAYMSPEQAGATGEDVDTRSDIYSLGVLLYELLTGRPPFEPERLRQAAVDEVFRIIRDEEPARPSARLTEQLTAAKRVGQIVLVTPCAPLSNQGHLFSRDGAHGVTRHTATTTATSAFSPRRLQEWIHQVRGDLDWIVMKALEKQPSRRYETASEFARDIGRHMSEQPILARPPTLPYRVGKLIRRKKGIVFSTGFIMVALLTAFFVSITRYTKEHEARQFAVTAERKAVEQAARSQATVAFLQQMLESVGPSVALGRDTTLLRQVLDQAVGRIDRELKGHPEAQADLCAIIGRTYYDIGNFDQAEQMQRTALELLLSIHGPVSSAIAGCLLDLAGVLNTRGHDEDHIEAESHARRAVTIRQDILGREDPAVADALDILAWSLAAQGKRSESVNASRASLAIKERHLGSHSVALVQPLSSLGWFLLGEEGRLAEAEQLLRRALDISRSGLPPGHPFIYEQMRGLSAVLIASGRYTESETTIREIIQARRTYYGEKYETLPSDLIMLADNLAKQKRLPEAEEAMREAIEVQIIWRGDEHFVLAKYHYQNLVQILCEREKWEEAEHVAFRWASLAHKLNDEKTRFFALQSLASILIRLEKWREAEQAILARIAICERSVGKLDWAPLECETLQQLAQECRFKQQEALKAGSEFQFEADR